MYEQPYDILPNFGTPKWKPSNLIEKQKSAAHIISHHNNDINQLTDSQYDT